MEENKQTQPQIRSATCREEALAALAAHGGNVSKTARELEIPATTLRRWRNERIKTAAANADDQEQHDLASDLESIAGQLIDAIPGKIETAPLNQLTSTLKFAHETLQSIRENRLKDDALALDFSKMTDEQLEQLEALTAYLLGIRSGAAVPEPAGALPAAEAVGRPALSAAMESSLLAALLRPQGSDSRELSTIPELHHWLSERLGRFHEQRPSRLAVIAPRESAKTTWITLAFVLRCAVENREPYILLLSDSRQQAEKYLKDIRKELEQSEIAEQDPEGEDTTVNSHGLSTTLAAIYPEACGKGPEWRKDHLLLRNGVLIESLGRGSKIRGRKNRQHRPTLIVIDDCQSNRDIYSRSCREHALRWFAQEVLPCGSPTTNVISVGSALHRDAVAVRAMSMPGWTGRAFAAILSWPEQMDLWKQWELLATNIADANRLATAAAFYDAHRTEMDRGGVSFWPSYKPLSALMMKRAEIGPRRFETEYQGKPDTPEGAEWPSEYFDRANFFFTEWPQNILVTVVALDPSKGGKDQSGDFQALVAIALTRDGNLWVDCECHREPIPEMMDRAVQLAKKRNAATLVVETNQGLNLLIPEFERFARAAHLSSSLQGVEHYAVSKVARIRRLGTYLARGQIRVLNSTGGRLLVDQLREFPNGGHDDAPDALEIGIRALEVRVG